MIKEGQKGKGTLGCQIFPFLSISSFSAQVVGQDREVIYARKDVIRLLGNLCFLVIALFLISSKFRFELKAWSLEAVSTATFSVIGRAHLPWPHFESCWMLRLCGATGILCSQGILNAVCGQAARKCRQREFMYLCSSSHAMVPFDFTSKTQVQR